MVMEKDKKEDQVFDAGYVKELRDEAATWRTKFRELEVKLAAGDVEKELMKRGIQAEAEWVKVAADQSVSEAVDSFVEKYPHLVPAKVEPNPEDNPAGKRKVKLAPMSSGKTKSNSPGPDASGKLDRSVTEIKEDPKARANLRAQYRELLSASSHRDNQGE